MVMVVLSKVKFLSVFILLMSCVYHVNAAHLGNVKITDIRLFDSLALVALDKNIVPASCAVKVDGVTPLTRHVVVKLDNDLVASRRLSVLLTAQAQGKVFNPNCLKSCNQTFSSWLGSITECNEVRIQN